MNNPMTAEEFQEHAWGYYRDHARSMPWRANTDPYWVLVSEIMLQQTQVDRVRPKFEQFMQRFPDISSLAEASFSDVLAVWSGLGYNRRAKFIHAAAQVIVNEFDGRIPNDQKLLESLPGIGPNTASAIRAYSFNEPVVFVETNIRAAIIHDFFGDSIEPIHDTDVISLVAKVLDKEHPREWYWALMDYGTHLKKTRPNPSRRSAHHIKQSTFEGSLRQLRGRLLRMLATKSHSQTELRQQLNDPRVPDALAALVHEGMVKKTGSRYQIAD